MSSVTGFVGDIWVLHAKGHLVVVPTNLVVGRDGAAVMGAGLARQARDRYPGLASTYGSQLLAGPLAGLAPGTPPSPRNVRPPFVVVREFDGLILAPTKHAWRDPSDLGLITASLGEITALVASRPDLRVALPQLGCGAGERDWATEVRPLVLAVVRGLPEEARGRITLVRPA